jgi:DNA-binding transcriptional ArsR family regulator
MNTVFEVVADPARRRLLDALRHAPRPVGELIAATGLSQPSTSRHLRILREAGLVARRSVGRHRIYEIRPQGFTELADWLTPYVLLLQGGPDAARADAAHRSAGSPLG